MSCGGLFILCYLLDILDFGLVTGVMLLWFGRLVGFVRMRMGLAFSRSCVLDGWCLVGCVVLLVRLCWLCYCCLLVSCLAVV